MAFFSSFPAGELTPVFRLLDDFSQQASGRNGPCAARQSAGCARRSFQPRFDIKELDNAYELYGELPGIDQSNVNIEFTDATTLSISGRTERVVEHGTRPQTDATPASNDVQSTEAPLSSASSQKATVEDDFEEVTSESATPDEQTEASTVAADTTPAATEKGDQEVTQSPANAAATTATTPQGKYWLSERSVGSFRRSFTFASRVDQEAVTASLKNGILSIIVPKAPAPVHRRVNIE